MVIFIIIGIFDTDKEIYNALTLCFEKTGTSGLSLVSLNVCTDLCGTAFDLIVIDKLPVKLPVLHTHFLICAAPLTHFAAKRCPKAIIVTYGLSQRDSVSLSACSDNTAIVCFQREITPICGFAPSLGEISVPILGDNPSISLVIGTVFRSLGLV